MSRDTLTPEQIEQFAGAVLSHTHSGMLDAPAALAELARRGLAVVPVGDEAPALGEPTSYGARRYKGTRIELRENGEVDVGTSFGMGPETVRRYASAFADAAARTNQEGGSHGE